MTDRWDCLCAGIVVADQVCDPIARLPKSGELVPTDRLTFTIGGCAANVAVDLARLGAQVAISGCVGSDLFGNALQEQLTASGVDCSRLVPLADQPTSGTFVINVKGEDRRFIHCIGANGVYDGTQVTDDDLARTKILYLGGYCLLDSLSPKKVIDLFQRARKAGVTTILDVVIGGRQNCWEWTAPVLPYTDAFLPNQDEAALITGKRDPWEQSRMLREAGCGTVVITCGHEGTVYDGPDGRYRSDIFHVPALDSTGTGDAFVAGYVLGRLNGASTIDTLNYGSALGASCVQSIGATTGVFNRVQLTEFLSRQRLDVQRVD